MSFNQYHEWRALKDFSNKFNQYCEAIAISGKDFDQVWSEEILPVLQVSEGYEDENSLLNEFWGGLKNMFGGGQAAAPAAPGFTPNQNPEMHAWMLKNDPHYAKGHQRVQKLGQFQGQVDQMTADIKGRFANAMKGFLKMMNDDALKQQNPNMYKIAQNFYNKILAAAQPVIDGFKMKAKYGTPDHGEFQQKHQMMQQSQRQGSSDKLKNNLSAGGAYDRATNPNPSSMPTRAPFGGGKGY